MKKMLLIGMLLVIGSIFTSALAQRKFYGRGLAEVIRDGAFTNKKLAVHRSLPRGTLVQVRNPANGRLVTVRVVDKLPDIGANQKIIIKLSESAYHALYASGQRFAVELFEPPKEQKITHTVDEGDTLYALSKKYDVSVEDIKHWNELEDDVISLGQELMIIKKP